MVLTGSLWGLVGGGFNCLEAASFRVRQAIRI